MVKLLLEFHKLIAGILGEAAFLLWGLDKPMLTFASKEPADPNTESYSLSRDWKLALTASGRMLSGSTWTDTERLAWKRGNRR